MSMEKVDLMANLNGLVTYQVAHINPATINYAHHPIATTHQENRHHVKIVPRQHIKRHNWWEFIPPQP
jgi:hypothetical protein